jgi:hypothetical protein
MGEISASLGIVGSRRDVAIKQRRNRLSLHQQIRHIRRFQVWMSLSLPCPLAEAYKNLGDGDVTPLEHRQHAVRPRSCRIALQIRPAPVPQACASACVRAGRAGAVLTSIQVGVIKSWTQSIAVFVSGSLSVSIPVSSDELPNLTHNTNTYTHTTREHNTHTHTHTP